MIVIFIFNNYTMNLCCLWADGQLRLNEAQPSELTMIVSCLIVLAQQKAGFVALLWLVYTGTKYLSYICWLINSYTVLMSCETAIHSCWWWPDTATMIVMSFHWPNCLVQKSCEIILYIIIKNVELESMSVEHCEYVSTNSCTLP